MTPKDYVVTLKKKGEVVAELLVRGSVAGEAATLRHYMNHARQFMRSASFDSGTIQEVKP